MKIESTLLKAKKSLPEGKEISKKKKKKNLFRSKEMWAEILCNSNNLI